MDAILRWLLLLPRFRRPGSISCLRREPVTFISGKEEEMETFEEKQNVHLRSSFKQG